MNIKAIGNEESWWEQQEAKIKGWIYALMHELL